MRQASLRTIACINEVIPPDLKSFDKFDVILCER